MDKFFTTLFSDLPHGARILIWKKGEKKISTWLPNAVKAAEFVKNNTDADIYVGCGVASDAYIDGLRGRHPYVRCPKDKIAGIPGLWLDVDLANPAAHKKENLPKDENDIQQILSAVPLPPTIVVDSGHGRQFWWAFHKFWAFASDEERTQAADIAHRFTFTMREKARTMGFDLDMTFDLARVFRIPGCLNYKYPPAVPTRLLHLNGDRYALEDFIPHIVVSLPEKPKIKKAETPHFALNPNADISQSKFEALCEAEPRFRKTWEMKRKDFKSGDTSASSYDFSLANFAFMAGWDWQETVNLIIAFRRKHGLDLKLRIDYYERTLANVMNTMRENQAQQNIENIILGTSETQGKSPEQIRADALQNASTLLGVPVQRIIKYKSDPASYRMIANNESIYLGDIGNLTNNAKLRNKIADATKYLIPTFKPRVWNQIAQSLLIATEDESVGEESTEVGAIGSFLQQYFMDKQDKITTNLIEAENSKSPFIKDGLLHFFGPNFREWLSLYHKETITLKDMGIKLKLFGCSPRKMTMRAHEDDTSLRATHNPWTMPPQHELVKQIMLRHKYDPKA